MINKQASNEPWPFLRVLCSVWLMIAQREINSSGHAILRVTHRPTFNRRKFFTVSFRLLLALIEAIRARDFNRMIHAAFYALSNPVLVAQYERCSKNSAKSCFLGTFPIFSWLHSYKSDDFVGDLISGCTVAVMHIPQGMGYALLGGLPPVVGIYMAFFPVLMYVLFGTSRHNSMGL